MRSRYLHPGDAPQGERMAPTGLQVPCRGQRSKPALCINGQRRGLPGQFGLVSPETHGIKPPGRIEAPDLVGEIEQPPG
jgi:hypothetical protein